MVGSIHAYIGGNYRDWAKEIDVENNVPAQVFYGADKELKYKSIRRQYILLWPLSYAHSPSPAITTFYLDS
jgi:hypothetical protein